MRVFRILLLLFPFWLVACGDAANPFPTTIVVEWTTASEVNTAGFNLYRGQTPDGPFAKINASLIPASTDSISGKKYRYDDSNLTPGQTYYYQLEDVERSGASAKHGPITITAPFLWQTSGVLAVAAALGVLVLVGGGLYLTRRRSR